MPKLILAVSGKQSVEPARELIREIGLDAEILDATEDDVVGKVLPLMEDGARVVVARGRLAVRLKAERSIPVIEVIMSGQDMAELLEKACLAIGHPRARIALIGQRYMFSNPEPFARILGAEADIYYLNDKGELPDVLVRAREAGAECVIGDDIVCAGAAEAGFRTVYIGAARDSLITALRSATRLSDALGREARRMKELRQLIEYSSDAIILLDEQRQILSVNPGAEKALGQTAAALRGKKLTELEGLILSAPLLRALEKHENSYAVILQFGQTSYVANITAIMLAEQQEGWMISMQEFAAIDDLDERVRQERQRRGYVAHARFAGFPARSPAMKAVLEEAEAYAPYDVPILLTGEPRLAKARLAECIHNASLRRRNPYVAVDLGTIPPENQFDLLFGRRDRGDIGLVSQAHKGALFLLDVHTLVPDCQRQLLSILRDSQFRRRDTLEPIPVSVRLICSTFVDLMELARHDKWMWQLANTLLGLSLRMPPIREMPEDIPTYIREYMELSAARFKKRVTLTDEALEHLCRYPWRNNLRDIEYFALRATMLADGPVIGLDFVRQRLLTDLNEGEEEQRPHIVAGHEELELRRVLRETGGQRAPAAEKLGISRATLWRRMKKYGITQE